MTELQLQQEIESWFLGKPLCDIVVIVGGGCQLLMDHAGECSVTTFEEIGP